jgi:hypothetical protein
VDGILRPLTIVAGASLAEKGVVVSMEIAGLIVQPVIKRS